MGRRLAVLAAAAALTLAGCSDNDAPADPEAAPEPTHETGHTGHATTKPAAKVPLRKDERLVELTMPASYTPEAPTYGTDDYRCFVLDPGLKRRSFVTGVDVLPGNPDVVHHVILFQVPPDQVDEAEAKDAETPGQGWTCFGGTGLSGAIDGLDQAPWIGAWAPGGGERVMADDIGIPLEPGTRVIMQVHYNLLAGDSPDTSSAVLRMAPGTRDLQPLETTLLIAPVELPCRPGHDTSPLCDRGQAVFDVTGRFGGQAGFTVGGLQLLCGGNPQKPKAGPVQHCDRTVSEAGTIRAIAGHMHLLGRRIKIEVNPGTPGARTLLDVHPWNFDEQGSVPVEPPAQVDAGDTLRVTCRHSQTMRDLLPDLKGIPERYVVWGEGTTDEMCLGIVLMTRG
jgi:Copper type II ascorbate-dependent monooxygenase, N-terminal domain/Copper type II ascorbate-dependent monooxygenase, C-terminal domain